MSLSIRKKIFITAAVTGSGNSQDKSKFVPRSPKEIANAAIESAEEGAAVVHCHVRDPESGKPSRKLEYYKEVTELIRASNTDVVLNLTTGMGGDITTGPPDKPLPLNNEHTDLVGFSERLQHIKKCLPEICTLDCGTMNFGENNYIMANPTGMLREMANEITKLGVKPEIEVFDTGHLWFAKQLIKENLIDDPILIQLCLGIPWGAPDDINTLMSMVNNLPKNSVFSAFSIAKNEMPYVAAAVLSGGNVRVGLEDNIWMQKGVLATNQKLVKRAVGIIERMGVGIMTPKEVRNELKLKKQSPKL